MHLIMLATATLLIAAYCLNAAHTSCKQGLHAPCSTPWCCCAHLAAACLPGSGWGPCQLATPPHAALAPHTHKL